MSSIYKLFKLIAFASPIALMTIACQEDLTSVEKFGTTSVSIQETSTKMIQDIYDSCTRKEYVQIQYDNARKMAAPRADITPDNPRDSLPAMPNLSSLKPRFNLRSSPYEFPPAKIRFKCLPKTNQAQVMQNMNDVLAIYVATLGRLASPNTVTFDQNLKAIGESIKSLNKEVRGSISSPTPEVLQTFDNGINNGINIATSLLNLFANQQRQEKLKPIIICSNDNVTKYIDDLQKLIQLFYITGVLKEEEDVNLQYIEELYSSYLADASASKPETNTEVYMLLENDYRQRIDGIETRRASAQAYINILEKTSRTHQALAKTFRGDMAPADQKILCQNEGYISDPSIQQSSLDLTPQQVQKAQQILSDYEVSIQPSLKVLKKPFAKD
ncbi:hypothetical protein HCU40_16950 [Pseudanabaena biceps]|nr:hypothetical protein [Pseudanabaena biceps]